MSWFLLVLGAAAGGFVNGLAGFGTALFALGFWLQFLPPAQAVAIAVMVSTVTGLQGVLIVRRDIRENSRRLAIFVCPALPGVLVGAAALSFVEPGFLKFLVAAFMLLYGGFFILRRNLPRIDRSTPLIDAIVGFLGGILGGAASLSGVLPTMWCAMRAWPKSETRAVLQPFNVIVLGVTAAVFFITGAYDAEVLTLLAVALPVAVISAQAGIAAFRRLGDDGFRRLLIGLMFFSGVALVLRSLV
ncbi:MAG: sulfite exporter TauE/SafE family protein [Rhodobacter sp.]|nr:sulfite exporter TauE/SafE family protein [Rhodobacter sp.]MCY4241497.1 sulfite exporter TauE/SafE family protein [Rhodobacter sp.]